MSSVFNAFSNYITHFPQLFSAFVEFLKSDHLSRLFLGIASLSILVLMVLPNKIVSKSESFHSKDLQDLAGEDLVSTQLDLARAYIEMDKKPLAKKVLKSVVKQGNSTQQQEAKQLIKAL